MEGFLGSSLGRKVPGFRKGIIPGHVDSALLAFCRFKQQACVYTPRHFLEVFCGGFGEVLSGPVDCIKLLF
jgi:hypothetical protein